MKIAMMGAGGLGGYLGAKLAQAGEDVTFISREKTVQGIREHGVRVHSYKDDFTIHPAQATDNPAEIGVVDLIVFGVKSYDLDAAIESAKPLVGPNTVIIPLQNGVGHVQTLQNAFGEQPVLGGICMINAHKGEQPGEVHHVADLGQYQLEFGEWEQPVSARCEQLQKMWERAGINAVAVDNIVERMWWKLAIFSATAMYAVARGNKGKVWSPEFADAVLLVLAETMAVAQAQGVKLPDSLPDEINAIGATLPPTYKPSMLVDLENGSRLEVEAINGYISRLGKQLGVATPANDVIYASLKPHING